jgi:polar amino acid transport system substrate-binding protein
MKITFLTGWMLAARGHFIRQLLLGLLIIVTTGLLFGCGGPQEKKFSSLQDLNKPNVNIGVSQGSASEMASHKAFNKSHLQMFIVDVDGYEALRSKKLDAVAYDRDIMEIAVRNMPEMMILPQNYGTYKIGIGIKKENTELLQKVNAQLDKLEADGTLPEMKERWLGKKDQQLPAGVVKDDKSLPVITIGTSGLVPPWTFMFNNKLTGYDIELSWRLATALGKRPEFKIMNYDSLVAALETGKVDMVLANLNETTERLQKIAFSKPYCTSYAAVMIRKSEWAGADTKTAAAGSTNTQAAGNSNLTYKSIAEANGKTMAVVTGMLLDRDTERYLPKSPYKYYNNYTDCLTALKTGKVEGFLCDEPVAREMQRTNPEVGYLKEAVMPDQLGIGINKSRQDLKQVLDAGIKKYKADGTLKKLDQIWFGADDSLKVMPAAKTGSKGTVICAVAAENPPLAYIANGKLVGYECSLVTSILQDAGYTVVLQPMDFNAIIPSVTSGKADLLLGAVSITEERKQSILFSESDYQSGLVLMVRKAGAGKAVAGTTAPQDQLTYKTVAALNGKPVAVLTGTIFEAVTKKVLPKSTYSQYNTYADCIEALKSGKIEGFFDDEPVARNMTSKDTELGYIHAPVVKAQYGVGISKDRPEIKAALDAGLKRYKQDGTLKKLDQIWFGSDEKAKQMPAAKTGSKGTIRCAVAAESEPLVYVRNGKIVGYETALVTQILQDAGYTVELQNMNFDATIPSVVAHKSDLMFGAVSITEERKQSMLFSDSTYDGGVVAVVRKSVQPAANSSFMAGLKESFRRNFLVEDRYKMVLAGLKTTIYITICAAILGTILGFGVCMLRRSQQKLLSTLAKIFVKVMQGTPLVVFLMIMYYIVFGKLSINPIYVAIIAFAINMAAYTSEMMRTGIDAVDKGQLEAAYAMGFSKVQTFIKIVAPQALKHILPVYTGEFISMMKMTSIVGYIAIQDLTKMSDIIRSRTYEAFFPLIVTALIYLVVAWSLTSVLVYLEYKIDPKKRQRTLKGVELKQS